MTLKHHPSIRLFALFASALVVMLVWGVGVSFAAKGGTTLATYFEDESGNLCVGVGGFAKGFPVAENCGVWGEKVGTKERGEKNTGVGEKVMSRSTGNEDVGVGYDALAENEGGSGDTATGYFALLHNKGGGSNTATGDSADYRCGNSGGAECKENTETGASALRNNENGSGNAAFGFDALAWPEGVSGSEDVGVGYKAGEATNGGAHNIDIANEGVTGDGRTTRIGVENTEARAFVAGIWKKSIKEPTCSVKVNAEGQLGCEMHASAVSSVGSPVLLAQLQQEHAQIGSQQQEIDRLASELQSLRQEVRTHR
jgi:hypothetical protein